MTRRVLFRSRFADAIEKGDVFSLYRDGSEPVEVTDEPVKIKNLVGERRHVVLDVRLPGTQQTGAMIFSPSHVVYVRTVEV